MLGRLFLLLFLFSGTCFAAVLKSNIPVGCSSDVAKATHFMLSADYGGDSYPREVDDYLSGRSLENVVTDIESALQLATGVWGVQLTEFGSLRLQTCRGNETHCRVGMIVNTEVLAHRLTTSFVVAFNEPALFMALPERATKDDLRRLRHSLFYGMGLGVFDAVAGRQNLRLFHLTQSAESVRPAEFAIDEDYRRVQWRRQMIQKELPGSHFRAAADLFAYGFARKMARRSQMPTEDLDALMKLTGLEHSSVRLKLALSSSDAGANEQALLEWSAQLIKKARDLRSIPMPGVETLPDIDSPLLAKINAARIAKPTAASLREAQEGLKAFGDWLEGRRVELVAERIKALDDLIVRDLKL